MKAAGEAEGRQAAAGAQARANDGAAALAAAPSSWAAGGRVGEREAARAAPGNKTGADWLELVYAA